MSDSARTTPSDVTASLHLHAELLPNIRQITLYISIGLKGDPLDLSPIISLSESRRAVTVALPSPFEHVSETTKLPARVGEASRRLLSSSKPRLHIVSNTRDGSERREFSFRMPLDQDEEPLMAREDVVDDHVPWTAGDMSSSTRVRCRQCGTIFLGSPRHLCERSLDAVEEKGWVWKDLPSGNWAEMMDFWHCHKPDPHEGKEEDGHDHGHGTEAVDSSKAVDDRNAQLKGYGASNTVVAIPGTVLVDVATFLVAESDCTGLKKAHQEPPASSSTSRTARIVECTQCSTTIGMEDPVACGWRLLKSNLAVARLSADEESAWWETHPPETVVAAQLLELIERESARRFVVHCGTESGLLLWVFNPDLRYSNASPDQNVAAQRGMKVLFQDVHDVEALLNPAGGKATPLTLEELELPDRLFGDVSAALRTSNAMLPESARCFREWKVGLLNRFERSMKGV